MPKKNYRRQIKKEFQNTKCSIFYFLFILGCHLAQIQPNHRFLLKEPKNKKSESWFRSGLSLQTYWKSHKLTTDLSVLT